MTGNKIQIQKVRKNFRHIPIIFTFVSQNPSIAKTANIYVYNNNNSRRLD